MWTGLFWTYCLMRLNGTIMSTMTTTEGPVLLYDGTCGLCHATVRFILRHDKNRSLRFASLTGNFGRSIVEKQPELEGVDSVVWLEPAANNRAACVLVRSTAALRVARYLGGPWRLFLVFALVPRTIRDRLYDLLARHRHLLAGPKDDCFALSPETRGRFLDSE